MGIALEHADKVSFKTSVKPLDISVFGLGKVGLTLSSCLAAAGHKVIGVDVNQHLIDSINDKSIRCEEPGVLERLHRASERFVATSDTQEAVLNTELSFIIVPTPSNTLGGFSLRFVLEACESIGKAIRNKKGYHVISLISTVLPGSSDQIILPLLEKASGRKLGEGIGYCYNPSFIALGEVVKGIERPDYLLIGENESSSGDVVLQAYQQMIVDSAPVARMSPIEAEITKLASNTHETLRVSFANMLMAACNETPGANVDRITEALSHRMGKRFFKGAVPFGGPCWPRDNKALSLFLDAIDVSNRMPSNVDLFNEEHGRYILRKILEHSQEGDKVSVIGLAYKPGTYFIEKSYAVDLIQWLYSERRLVFGWDPLAMEEVSKILKDTIHLTKTAEEALKKGDLIIIINPLKELASIDFSFAKNKKVIDCWRCLKSEQIKQIGSYIPLGIGGNTDKKAWLDHHLKNKLEFLTN